MLANIPLVLSALSAVTAWPIFFYESSNCNHYPVLTLEHPPPPGHCFSFGHVDIHSYSGQTMDHIQKILLYNSFPTCEHDAAHHAFFNHTIGNASTTCHSFKGLANIPRNYVFIEEILGPINNNNTSIDEVSACDALVVQK